MNEYSLAKVQKLINRYYEWVWRVAEPSWY